MPKRAGSPPEQARHLAGAQERRLPVVAHSKLSHRRMRGARELQRERVGGRESRSAREGQTESEYVAVRIRY